MARLPSRITRKKGDIMQFAPNTRQKVPPVLLAYSKELQKKNPIRIGYIDEFINRTKEKGEITPELADEYGRNQVNFARNWRMATHLCCDNAQFLSPVNREDFLAFRAFFKSTVSASTPFIVFETMSYLRKAEIPSSALFPNTPVAQAICFLEQMRAEIKSLCSDDFSWNNYEEKQISHIMLRTAQGTAVFFKEIYGRYYQNHWREIDVETQRVINRYLDDHSFLW